MPGIVRSRLIACDNALGAVRVPAIRPSVTVRTGRIVVRPQSRAGALPFNALVPEHRSVTVTTIRSGDGIDADPIRRHARETLGVSVAGGLGVWAARRSGSAIWAA